MTPQTIITTVRAIVNDADVVLYRNSNTTLLGYVNDGIKEISSLQPSLFTTIITHTCAVGEVEQTITFPEVQAIVKVMSLHDGAALTPFDMPSMDQFNPNWRTDTAGTATQWSRLAGDPLRFFIYPKAPVAAQNIDLICVAIPTVLAIGDTVTELPAAYEPALVDYVVYRVESTDDEHVDTQRAAGHYAAFVAKVKGA